MDILSFKTAEIRLLYDMDIAPRVNFLPLYCWKLPRLGINTQTKLSTSHWKNFYLGSNNYNIIIIWKEILKLLGNFCYKKKQISVQWKIQLLKIVNNDEYICDLTAGYGAYVSCYIDRVTITPMT